MADIEKKKTSSTDSLEKIDYHPQNPEYLEDVEETLHRGLKARQVCPIVVVIVKELR